MVLTKVKLLLSLSDSAQEDSIGVALESLFGLVEEGQRRLNISVLARCQYGDNSILDRV